eukprot:4512810-Amphidinium_carterae.1
MALKENKLFRMQVLQFSDNDVDADRPITNSLKKLLTKSNALLRGDVNNLWRDAAKGNAYAAFHHNLAAAHLENIWMGKQGHFNILNKLFIQSVEAIFDTIDWNLVTAEFMQELGSATSRLLTTSSTLKCGPFMKNPELGSQMNKTMSGTVHDFLGTIVMELLDRSSWKPQRNQACFSRENDHVSEKNPGGDTMRWMSLIA